jgi:hypothetical protein
MITSPERKVINRPLWIESAGLVDNRLIPGLGARFPT